MTNTHPIEPFTMESLRRLAAELPPGPPDPPEIHTTELMVTHDEAGRAVPMDFVLRLGNKYVMHPALREALEREILKELSETGYARGE